MSLTTYVHQGTDGLVNIKLCASSCRVDLSQSMAFVYRRLTIANL